MISSSFHDFIILSCLDLTCAGHAFGFCLQLLTIGYFLHSIHLFLRLSFSMHMHINVMHHVEFISLNGRHWTIVLPFNNNNNNPLFAIACWFTRWKPQWIPRYLVSGVRVSIFHWTLLNIFRWWNAKASQKKPEIPNKNCRKNELHWIGVVEIKTRPNRIAINRHDNWQVFMCIVHVHFSQCKAWPKPNAKQLDILEKCFLQWNAANALKQ